MSSWSQMLLIYLDEDRSRTLKAVVQTGTNMERQGVNPKEPEPNGVSKERSITVILT